MNRCGGGVGCGGVVWGLCVGVVMVWWCGGVGVWGWCWWGD